MLATHGDRSTARLDAAEVAARVVDPELPMLTLADLGILGSVTTSASGAVLVEVTPTYSGCPALTAICADLVAALRGAGHDDVEVRVLLAPAWSSDRITDRGRERLRRHGISPPSGARAAGSTAGSVAPLNLGPVRRAVSCPQCGSASTTLLAEFGSTACKALYRCVSCREPFEHMKEI